MDFLRTLWKGWKAFAHALGRVQTVILLTLFYVLILTPTGLLLRLFGKRPLAYTAAADAKSFWVEKKADPSRPRGLEQYYQLY